MRLLHEASTSKHACFITLTYDDDHYPPFGSLMKIDLRLFFKRLRKDSGVIGIKYYACGEYGEESDRPHYHAILFGLSDDYFDLYRPNPLSSIEASKALERLWPYGINSVDDFNYQTAAYTARYVQKKLYGDDVTNYGLRTPPFQLCSKKLGLDFALANQDQIKRELNITINGRNVGLLRVLS